MQRWHLGKDVKGGEYLGEGAPDRADGRCKDREFRACQGGQ